MRRIPVYLSLVAIIVSAFALYFSKTSSELVYVDVNKLIEGYKSAKIAKKDLEKKSEGAKANIDSLMTNWQKELAAYEAGRQKWSHKELKLKQELLGTKQRQINGYRQSVEKQ